MSDSLMGVFVTANLRWEASEWQRENAVELLSSLVVPNAELSFKKGAAE